jgi:flagellar biogenesis protein FliO
MIEWMIIAKSLLVLAILIMAMFGLAFLLQRIEQSRILRGTKNRSLKIEEVLYLDQKRKIVSIQRENKTYIILLGENETLLEIISNS